MLLRVKLKYKNSKSVDRILSMITDDIHIDRRSKEQKYINLITFSKDKEDVIDLVDNIKKVCESDINGEKLTYSIETIR